MKSVQPARPVQPVNPDPRRPRSTKTTTVPTSVRQQAATRVLRRFRIVFNTVKSHFRDVERRTGVGGAKLWALSVIAETPGVGVGALASAMDIRQSTASNLVRSLIAQGYVAPRKGEQDRRTTLLTVLPAGAAILQRAPAPFTGVLPDALGRLDPAILDRLDQDLGTLIEVLEADIRAANIPLADL